jgi:hypothetical protein
VQARQPPGLTAERARPRRQRVGAKIQCTSCYTAYHPLCARIAGMKMEIVDSTDGRDGPDAPVRPVAPRACTMRALSGSKDSGFPGAPARQGPAPDPPACAEAAAPPAQPRAPRSAGSASAQVRMVSYCPRHCTARPELSGVAALAPEDAAAAAGDDGNGLWNAQPFRPPPAVPVPVCAAGCARAQPLEARPAPGAAHT